MAPGLKTGDLVVGLVGGDVRSGGKLVCDLANAVQRKAQLLQPFFVGVEILARRRQDDGLFTQKRKAERDVSRRAPEFFLHAVHRETDIQDVDFFRQNVVLEFSRKIHDPVVGQGTGNEYFHDQTPFFIGDSKNASNGDVSKGEKIPERLFQVKDLRLSIAYWSTACHIMVHSPTTHESADRNFPQR